MSKFKGLGVAMVTPFKTDKSVDFDGLDLVKFQLLNMGEVKAKYPNAESWFFALFR